MSLPPIKHCSMFTEKNDWSKFKKKTTMSFRIRRSFLGNANTKDENYYLNECLVRYITRSSIWSKKVPQFVHFRVYSVRMGQSEFIWIHFGVSCLNWCELLLAMDIWNLIRTVCNSLFLIGYFIDSNYVYLNFF